MSRPPFRRAPRSLRRLGVTLDNIALVPASLLPQKARYQAFANQLPPGSVLIVLPTTDTRETRILQATAARFLAKGRWVRTITEADLTIVTGP